MRPTYIFHADWGAAPNKRWLAQGVLGGDGRYTAYSPIRIEDHADLVPSIRKQIGGNACAFVGFDFPIGISVAYAQPAGVTAFKEFLRGLGNGKWAHFYDVARMPSVNLRSSSFLPLRAGRKKTIACVKRVRIGCHRRPSPRMREKTGGQEGSVSAFLDTWK